MKKKVFLDIIMLILLMLLMFMDFTGVLIHEILGISLFVVAFIHIYLNRKILFGIKLSNPNVNSKLKFKVILYWLILIALILSTITGIGNSPDIFSFINLNTGLWHLYFSYIAFSLMLVHFIINLKIVYRTLKIENIKRAVVFTTLLLAILFSYLFYKDFLKKPKATEEVIDNNSPSDVEEKETLESYLRKLRCGGCGRNCSLFLPQCVIGEAKKEQATADYYTKYGLTETANTISYKTGSYEIIIKL